MSELENWLQAASEQLAHARQALNAGQFGQAGFYAQRAVANAVKGLIAASGEPVPDESEVVELLDWIPPAYQASLLDELRTLDDYYAASAGDVTTPASQPDAALFAGWAAETIETVRALAEEM